MRQMLEMPRKSWWARLPFGVRMAAGTGALLLVSGGATAAFVALTTNDEAKPQFVTALGEAAAGDAAVGTADGGAAPGRRPAQPVARGQLGAEAARSRTAAEADRTANRDPARVATPAGSPTSTPAAAAKAAARPVITTRTETETREIPYSTRVVRDPSMPRGIKQVQTPGMAGEKSLRYLVTVTDGRPTDRRLVDSTVTRQPQQQVVALGDLDSDLGPGDWEGSWPGGGQLDHHGRCGAVFNFCMPIGRGESCPDEEDASTIQAGGDVAVRSADVDVLSGHGC
jgi:hypothetical protein